VIVLFTDGTGGIRQKNLQNLDSMQLEGGFGGMRLKIEMILQEVFDERVSFQKSRLTPKTNLKRTTSFFQDEGFVIDKL